MLCKNSSHALKAAMIIENVHFAANSQFFFLKLQKKKKKKRIDNIVYIFVIQERRVWHQRGKNADVAKCRICCTKRGEV